MEIASKVLQCRPFQLKGARSMLGRGSLQGLNVEAWDNVAQAVMEAGAEQQLRANAPLCNILMGTGSAYIAEANPYDSRWGIGLSAAAAASVPRASWGANWHGKILMRRRDALEGAASGPSRTSPPPRGAAPRGGVT